MALPKLVADLLQEVFARYGKDGQQMAEEDPEACLVSLLTVIKRRLPEVYATLSMTVEMAVYEKDVKAARRKLEEVSS